jgi:hypothetical protein
MRLLAALSFAALLAAQSDHPTGPRITPPTLNAVSPIGFARGVTAEMTVEGLNLAGASSIHFSEPGVKGRILRVKELPDLPDIRLGSNGTPSTIDVGPLPPRNQVTVELDIDPEAHIGPVRFRLLTPLGTSPEGTILIEPYYGESQDKEPNDSADAAVETFLPAVLTGTISRPGDQDFFKIKVRAGEQIVFLNQAPLAGSALQPVVRILSEDMTTLAEFGNDGGPTTQRFAHTFDKTGHYYVRITDYEQSGRAGNFYRIIAGKLPVALSAYPLGLRKGQAAEIQLIGHHLGKSSVRVQGEPSPRAEDALFLRPASPNGPAFNELKLALGTDPELDAASAKSVTLPETINGRIPAPVNGVPSYHDFRFSAKKGQKVVLEVNARRLGSDLDSLLEVLDSRGQPIEHAVARATWETFLVLRDHDSVQRGLRIQSWNVLNVGDYVLVGNEICRVEEVPDGPDEDMLVESFGGQRRAFFTTSSEAHGIDRAVYKVQMHPAGAKFSPNGLPLVRLYYRNDDGGPGYGKDSFLEFTAPADGEYIARLRDVRGLGGESYAYRLSLREPRPDFRLSLSPRNPNVPAGGTVPVTVTALRTEGFEGPIEVSLQGLPAGLKATTNTIAPGLDSATILLSAGPNAQLKDAVPFEAIGRAQINGAAVTRRANPEDRTKLIALMPQADAVLFSETKVVELEPGQTAEVTVRARRNNGFAGRIPVTVTDLPVRVRVTDSGLNGVLIHEDDDSTTFRLWALPNAAPVEGYIYLSARIETRSPQPSAYAAAEPILVRVKPGKQISAAAPASVERSSAPK